MYTAVIPYLSAGPLSKEQVISELRRIHPAAVIGKTIGDCPLEKGWRRCMCDSEREIVYKNRGPNGGLHAIGLSMKPPRHEISYGNETEKTCCDLRPLKTERH